MWGTEASPAAVTTEGEMMGIETAVKEKAEHVPDAHLEPCPFCNGDALLPVPEQGTPFRVSCIACEEYLTGGNARELIALWNRASLQIRKLRSMEAALCTGGLMNRLAEWVRVVIGVNGKEMPDHDHEGEEPIFSQYLGGSDGRLAQCPFCGNEDLRVIECSERSQPGVGPRWLVQCDCVEGPSSDTRDEAIEKWNHRATPGRADGI